MLEQLQTAKVEWTIPRCKGESAKVSCTCISRVVTSPCSSGDGRAEERGWQVFGRALTAEEMIRLREVKIKREMDEKYFSSFNSRVSNELEQRLKRKGCILLLFQ